MVYVMMRLTVGNISFTIDMQLYLRASTVRRINRAREKGQHLRFRTKLKIARDMLKAIAPYPLAEPVAHLDQRWPLKRLDDLEHVLRLVRIREQITNRSDRGQGAQGVNLHFSSVSENHTKCRVALRAAPAGGSRRLEPLLRTG